MYCEHCGKQISDQAKVCPYCNQAAPSAPAPGSFAQTSRSKPSGSLGDKTVAGMSVFRFALAVCGALHVLAFFFLSYAKLAGASLLLSSMLPKKMTAMSYISFTFDMADLGMAEGGTVLLNTVVCLLPVLIGLLLVKNALKGKNRKSYLRSVGLAVAALLLYMLLGAAMAPCEDVGYELTSGAMLGCLLSVLTAAAAAGGFLMDPSVQQ